MAEVAGGVLLLFAYTGVEGACYGCGAGLAPDAACLFVSVERACYDHSVVEHEEKE